MILGNIQIQKKKYAKNCKDVREGMTLETAKLIMGDNNYSQKYNSEIFTTRDKATYYLHYPSALSSIGVDIYFDPVTKIVTSVICSDK